MQDYLIYSDHWIGVSCVSTNMTDNMHCCFSAYNHCVGCVTYWFITSRCFVPGRLYHLYAVLNVWLLSRCSCIVCWRWSAVSACTDVSLYSDHVSVWFHTSASVSCLSWLRSSVPFAKSAAAACLCTRLYPAADHSRRPGRFNAAAASHSVHHAAAAISCRSQLHDAVAACIRDTDMRRVSKNIR